MALQPSLQKLQVLLQLEENEAEIDLGIAQLLQHRRRRRRARRRFRVRPWILRRTDFGHYDRLMQELEAEDQESFTNFLRIPPEMLRELEERLSPRLLKQDTWFREALKLKLRLTFDGLGVLLLWLFLGSRSHLPVLRGTNIFLAGFSIRMFIWCQQPGWCISITDTRFSFLMSSVHFFSS